MNFFDTLRLALRNLREAKLRVALTIIGVLVGVAMIVTMVSFGLGLQRNTLARFRELDLFNEITVYGRSLSNLVELQAAATEQNGDDDDEDRKEKRATRTLDDVALEEITNVPHVVYVEPNVTFSLYARANDKVIRRMIGGVRVPNAASRFARFAAGRMIEPGNAVEAIVDESFPKEFGFKDAASAINAELQLLVPIEEAASRTENEDAGDGADEQSSEDDAAQETEVESFFGIPLGGGAGADASTAGLAARSFRIVGVLQDEVEKGQGRGRRFRGLLPQAGIYIPLAPARELSTTNRGALDEVALRLARASGKIGADETEGYNSAIVRVDDPANASVVERTLSERGFNSFGLFSQLDELSTVFLVINSALALLGGISLLVASFGIANTMIMAILERTREIGIMKAIGADDREIKLIFFVEAGVIGFLGGVCGALAAWGITAAANFLAFKFFLEPRGSIYIDFFHLPPWLWLGAILFAVSVAVLAALYPASRAARIDPVQALRHT